MTIAIADSTAIARALWQPKETLPGWTYNNAEFHALEKEHLFLSNWQIVCHVSELPNPGAYATLNLMGERAVVVRGENGEFKGFYNVCRHRAAAVVKGHSGSCRQALRCPYHGWTYGLDGALKAVPGEKTFPGLDKPAYGLTPIQVEIWMGFVFVRFRDGGPSVAERMAPYATELEPYRFADMIPAADIWKREPDVDWKNVMDNYLEGYHVPVGHPGLYRLFGVGYETDVRPGGVSRAMHWLRDSPSENWSERRYQTLLPEIDHLPIECRRAWAYYTLLPNVAIDVYPDQIDFFHVVPTAPGKCRIRSRAYRLPNPSPSLKAVQYLNWRINAQVQSEDEELVLSVQEGLGSESYRSGILSDKEVCLAQMHNYVRDAIPVATLPEAPEKGRMADMNEKLKQI